MSDTTSGCASRRIHWFGIAIRKKICPRILRSARPTTYIPMDAKAYVASLREELTHHLKTLDDRILANPKVKIVPIKDGHKISITPFEPQPDPENLAILKREITQRRAGTSLLDILKETDLRTDFGRFLQSGTERSHRDNGYPLWGRFPPSWKRPIFLRRHFFAGN